MARVTSKLQVTIPKRVADDMGISPGDSIEFVASGDSLRVLLPGRTGEALSENDRLALFDKATARQRARQRGAKPARVPNQRGWTRDALYDRARTR